jgi:hypothetical protein
MIPYENRPDWYKRDYTERAYNIVNSMYNQNNWKLPTDNSCITTNVDLMEEIVHLLNCEVGGHEIKYGIKDNKTSFEITSKGYHYYIGS